MTPAPAANAHRKMPDLFKDPVLRAYVSSVRDWHGYIRFLGLPDRRDNPDLIIDRLFVDPLLTRRHVSPDEKPDNWVGQAETVLKTLMNRKPLVLLGDPGAGKSTLVNYLVWLLARPGRNPLVDRLGWRLPVPMVLRELRLRGVTDFGGLIEAFLGHAMSEALRDGEYLNQALATGQAFILLDGIDEIGDPTARNDLRRAVFDGFTRYPDCRWMLTSRIVGYSEATFDQYTSDRRARGLRETRRHGDDGPIATRFIAPFDDRRIAAFARRWYVQRVAGRTRAEEDARDLVRAIREDPAILQLARVPNLLTMMALIHRVEATLPHGRALLYDRISEAYLESIDKFRGIYSGAADVPRKKLCLARVGYEMQRRRTEEQGHGEPEILVKADDVIGWLDDEMKRRGAAAGVSSAREFLDFVGRRSGLFLPRGDDKYAFIHLSFQEYFAAIALEHEVTGIKWARSMPSSVGVDHKTVSKWATRTVWRETFVFLFELLYAKQDWHEELRDCIFGIDYSSLIEEPEKDATNLAMLLARLVINRQSGLPQFEERAAVLACVRTEFVRSSRGWKRGRPSDVFSGLLSDDNQRTLQVLEIISEESYALNVKEIYLWGTQISDLTLLAKLTALERLNLTDTRVSDLTPLKRLVALDSLDLGITQVSGLKPLDHLKTLRLLVLRETQVCDLTPLKELSSLEQLDSGGTGVSDLTPLANLSSLNRLDLNGTRVSDLTPLTRLYSLRGLDLGGTQVSDLTPLANLSSLEALDLGGTGVSDLTPLITLSSLKQLHLYGTRVCDLTSLGRLFSLNDLNLGRTRVSDLRPLANLSSLRYLDLTGTQVSDLTPLSELSSLERLFVSGRVPERAVRKLREALPECDIKVYP